MLNDPPRMLDELCVRLSICLDPDARAMISVTQFRDLDSLEEAVLRADGVDPLTAPRRLRHDVRECIARYFR